jgi:hypothetical protein
MGIIPFIPASAAAASSDPSTADASAFRILVPRPRARMTAFLGVSDFIEDQIQTAR